MLELSQNFLLLPAAIQTLAVAPQTQEESRKSTLHQLKSGMLVGSTRLDLCGLNLTEFPEEIFELADTLEILNLSGNKLQTLPSDLGRLVNLKILFCSENNFSHLPEVLGDCPKLSMVAFRANKIIEVYPKSLPPSLRWLILTDNSICELPSTIGHCRNLQKLMLSGNRLQRLPEEMANCTALELIRLAANHFTELPSWLLSLPKLSWLAFAGNPCSTFHRTPLPKMLDISWHDLILKNKLGEGASGEIFNGLWCKNEEYYAVAIKLFKNSMTSDGLPQCEMETCLAAGSNEYLITVFGRLIDHPQKIEGLVMPLIDPSYMPLAGPPSFASCTRDVYDSSLRFLPDKTLSLLKEIASAAEHLHKNGIMHGDLYAHNILWHENNSCYLGDFGAATFYDTNSYSALALQQIEVRAFGCLIEELCNRTTWSIHSQITKEALHSLQEQCLSPEIKSRPSFARIVNKLNNLF